MATQKSATTKTFGSLSLTILTPVYLLEMKGGDNRFTREFIKDMNSVLDFLDSVDGPAALVTTGDGKFFSNGLSMEELMGGNGLEYFSHVEKLFNRFLTLGIPTVAAINGHAFAAGFMLALAHDYRYMREDRGFCCLPEVDLGIPYTPGVAEMLKSKLRDPNVIRDVMMLGRRFNAKQCEKYGIIEKAVSKDDVIKAALATAKKLAKMGEKRDVFRINKTRIYDRAFTLFSPSAKL